MLFTHTVFTRMPAPAYSLASALVRAMPAARASEVGTEAPGAALPAGVVVLMITPPRFLSAGSTARVQCTAPYSFNCRSSLSRSSSISSNEYALPVPALLTRMSMRPK